MNIYLASRFSNQDKMQGMRRHLQGMRHFITSRWLDVEKEWDSDENMHKYAATAATKDLEDIARADLLIVDLLDGQGARGGLNVEIGYALGKGISVWAIGPKVNIFHYHPNVVHFDNWSKPLQILRMIGESECKMN